MLFSDIIGQEDIKKKLIQSVRENRIPHAQLFLGPEGSGTLALALAYSQYINCKNRTEHDSCGICPSCIKYSKLTHPDLHFIFPTATNKKIKKDPDSELFYPEWRDYLITTGCYADLSGWYETVELENKQGLINVRDAQKLINKLNMKPYEDGYKVAIIWMPEKFNAQSANTLLKIIEEPPEKTLFILVAEDDSQILTTILSRTAIIKCHKLKTDEIRQSLIRQYHCTEDAARNAAILSEGNYNLACKYLKNEDNEKFLFQTLQKWMRYCFKEAISLLIDFITIDIKPLGREKQKEFLEYGLKVIHNTLLFNNNLGDCVMLPEEEKNFVKNFSPFINMNNAQPIAALMEESIEQIERNANASIVFLDDSIKIIQLLKIKR